MGIEKNAMRLDVWRDRLMEIWSQLGNQCAFGVMEIKGSARSSVGFQGDRRFEVGSTFKAFVAAEYARQVGAGLLDPELRLTVRDEERVDSSDMLDQLLDGATISVQDAAEAMIAVSDNTATDLVMRVVGVDKVRTLIAELGMSATTIPDSTISIYKRFREEPAWRPEACLTTMNDLTAFYAAVIVDRALGSDTTTDRFLQVMRQEDLLQGARWPHGVVCYRKSGLLEPPPQLAMGMAGAFMGDDKRVLAFAFALNIDFPEDAAFDDSPLEPLTRMFSDGLRTGLHDLAEMVSDDVYR